MLFFRANYEIHFDDCLFFRAIPKSIWTSDIKQNLNHIPFIVGCTMLGYLRYTKNSICYKRVVGVSRSGEIASAPRVFPGEILTSLSWNSRLEVSFAWMDRVKRAARQLSDMKIVAWFRKCLIVDNRIKKSENCVNNVSIIFKIRNWKMYSMIKV